MSYSTGHGRVLDVTESHDGSACPPSKADLRTRRFEGHSQHAVQPVALRSSPAVRPYQQQRCWDACTGEPRRARALGLALRVRFAPASAGPAPPPSAPRPRPRPPPPPPPAPPAGSSAARSRASACCRSAAARATAAPARASASCTMTITWRAARRRASRRGAARARCGNGPPAGHGLAARGGGGSGAWVREAAGGTGALLELRQRPGTGDQALRCLCPQALSRQGSCEQARRRPPRWRRPRSARRPQGRASGLRPL